VVLYNRPAAEPGRWRMSPLTFFFAGKAAPAYQLAKLIIKFLNNLAGTLDGRSRRCAAGSRSCSCPEYCASLAERLIPPPTSRTRSRRPATRRADEQHEVHDERGADDRHARRGHDRDGGGRGEENFFLFGSDGGAGGRQPRLVQSRSGTTTTSRRPGRRWT
jgi:starch phosphorylase